MDDAGSAAPSTEREQRYALLKGNLKAPRKRAGASRWMQKLCRVLEGYLGQLPNASESRVRQEAAHMGIELSAMEPNDDPGLHWDLAWAIP